MELLVTIIILALIFDYINGFHDAANSIATIVSTRVLTPFQAVIWAAFFNFVAFFIAKYIIGGFGIANTVSKTVVEQYITLPIILAGIIAAIMNDSQKVMGIIAAAMIAGHSMGLGMGINSINDLPDWVAFSCFTAISLGTMSGGWKIVKTMGTKITKVTPLEGVIAETAGAFTLYITEMLKIPVSTTHTITGAIIGVGATKRLSAVRWGVTQSLMTAWILTIPVSGLLAAAIYYIVSIFL